MENLVGKKCPVCNAELQLGEGENVCHACGYTEKISAAPVEPVAPVAPVAPVTPVAPVVPATNACVKCGTVLADDQMFCPSCGTAKSAAPQKSFCGKCGAELQPGQEFCSKCGQKVGLTIDQNVNTAINQFNTNIQNNADDKKKKKKMKPLIIVAIILVVFIIIAAISGSGSSTSNFNTMYSSIASESWCEIGSDGTWMKLDTNPYDLDDYNNTVAWGKIKSILNELGFSSSVAEEMAETRALDGRQTASTSEYEVSWTYHPDSGLEAMFKVK